MKATLGTLPGRGRRLGLRDQVGRLPHAGVRRATAGPPAELATSTTSPRKYPELRRWPTSVGTQRAVLDGELVVLDDDGRPRFELIQRHERQAGGYFVFDVLSIDGHDTIGLPYEERRRLLARARRRRRQLAVPAHRIGDGAGPARRHRRPGARGRDGQAARHDVPARRPLQGLAQGQEPPPGRGRDRRLHRRHGQPLVGTFGALLVGRCDDGRAGVRRRRRHRVHAAPARRADGPARRRCARDAARSTRRPRRRTGAARRGSSRCCGRRSRSPSSPTTATSARPASSS